MKKLLRHLLLIFAAAATLPLASCGGNGDDPDIPPTPTTDYKVETGTTDFDLYLRTMAAFSFAKWECGSIGLHLLHLPTLEWEKPTNHG